MVYEGIYKNLNEMFQKRVEKNPSATALMNKVNGKWEHTSWAEYYESSKNIGMALRELGFKKGEKASILSNSRIEWVMADMAIVGVGGATVAVYQSNTPEECEYILDNSDSTFVFMEDLKQLDKIKEIKKNLPLLKKAILFSGKNSENLDWVMTLDELREIGQKHDLEEFKKIGLEIKDTDPAGFIYTSGTTGNPKGAIITHKSLLADAEGIVNVITKNNEIKEGDDTLMFLPLAHVFAKIIHILTIYHGVRTSFAESIEKLVDNIGETRPHLMGSVPRIYEKVYAKIIGDVETAGGLKKKIFYWSLGVGREVSQTIQARKSLSPILNAKYKIAQKLVFNKLKDKFGGRLMFFVSSGAPLAKEIAEFFHAADILILEAYGLTEVSGAMTVNLPDHFKFGTVGPAMTTVDVKIAEDGEILCKGPIVMDGYFKREEATKEAIDEDGWFHTGDIGELDSDGFLKITDRKKDIIVTAAGKNIAPQNLENFMKGDRHISQIIVLGDKKKYLVALLNVNIDEVSKFADKNNIPYKNDAELTSHPKVVEFIEGIINDKNKELPSYNTIKYFRIVSHEFSIETGELTPSLKVKRKFCMEKYKGLIEAMYE